jgi:hypothetical protein
VVGNADIPLVPPSAVTGVTLADAVVMNELVWDVLLPLDAAVGGVEAADGAAPEEPVADEAPEDVLQPMPRKQKSADARAAKSATTRYWIFIYIKGCRRR